MAHGQIEPAPGVLVVEVVDRQGLGEPHLLHAGGQRDHGGQGVEHVVAPHLVGAIGQTVGVGGVGGGQQQGRGIGRAGRHYHDVAAPAFLAMLGLADHIGDRPARGVGLQPGDLAAGEQGDIGQAEQGFDGEGPRVALGLHQAGEAAAGLALDAAGGDGIGLVQPHAERQGEGAPALVLPMGLQAFDGRVVVDRGEGIGGFVTLLGGVFAPGAVHLPQMFSLGIVGGEVGEADGPGRGDPAGVLDLLEVALAQAHEGRAVEAGVSAHPVVGVGGEGLVVLVVPLFLGAIAVLDEHRLGVPVLRLPGQVLAPLQDQDGLARRRQPLGQGRTPGPGADDDHVEMAGHAGAPSGCAQRA